MREILVIREADAFTATLIENGFSVTNFPTIKTETVSDLSELESYIAEIEIFDGIFITSANAAEIVSAKLVEADKDFTGKFYVLGKRSRDLLVKSNFEVFFTGEATTAKELLESISKAQLKDKKFLFPRGNRSLRIIPETLENVAEVIETVVYRTTAIETDDAQFLDVREKIKRGKFNAICFFSPSGVEEFLNRFENFLQGEIKIAAIGPTTARCIEEKKLRVDFVSVKPAAKDFAFELADFLKC